jgi:hypothetical protein
MAFWGTPMGDALVFGFVSHISQRIVLLWLTRSVYRKFISSLQPFSVSSLCLCWELSIVHWLREVPLFHPLSCDSLKADTKTLTLTSQIHFNGTHSTPTLFATPCFGSSTLDEEAMTSNARKIALRRSTVSRRGSLSCLIGITNGGGRACLARSLVFICEGRWIFFVVSLLLEDKSIGFMATMGFFLLSSCRDCCCCCCCCCSF